MAIGARSPLLSGRSSAAGFSPFLRPWYLNVGTPGQVFVVWVFGGILSLFGALTYAEFAAAIPEAGGEYAYLRTAYGPFFGFLYGWTQAWVAKSGSIATLATLFFYYFANFAPALEKVLFTIQLPIGPNGGPLEVRQGQFCAMAVILILGFVNIFGVRVGGGRANCDHHLESCPDIRRRRRWVDG